MILRRVMRFAFPRKSDNRRFPENFVASLFVALTRPADVRTSALRTLEAYFSTGKYAQREGSVFLKVSTKHARKHVCIELRTRSVDKSFVQPLASRFSFSILLSNCNIILDMKALECYKPGS